MVKTLEFAGDQSAARELYEKGIRWWPEFQPMYFWNRLSGRLERGDFSALEQLEQEAGGENLPPSWQDSAALVAAWKSKSAAAARRACPSDADANYLILCMLVLADLGDQDAAYAFADTLYPQMIGKTPEETERIWLDALDDAWPLEFITSPAAAPLRRDPRYLALAERVGLLAYWRTGRLPDFCREQPEPICAQLRRR